MKGMLECTTSEVCIFKYFLWISIQVILRGQKKGSVGTDPSDPYSVIGELVLLQRAVGLQEIKLLNRSINLDHLYIETVPGFPCEPGIIGALRSALRLGSVNVNLGGSLIGERTIEIGDKTVQGLAEEFLIQVVPVGILVCLVELKFDFLRNLFIGLVHQGVVTGGAPRGDEEDFGLEGGPENLVDLVEDLPHFSGVVRGESSGEISGEVGSDGVGGNGGGGSGVAHGAAPFS